MVRINTNNQEIEYKGLFFPFKSVRTILQNTIPEESFLRFCVFKTFNKHTGKIDRKFAWDSIFQALHDTGQLTPILDSIIQKEYLD